MEQCLVKRKSTYFLYNSGNSWGRVYKDILITVWPIDLNPQKERDAQVETPSAPVPFGRTSFLEIQVCRNVEPCRLVKLLAIRSSWLV
jgi:hypothetical protein